MSCNIIVQSSLCIKIQSKITFSPFRYHSFIHYRTARSPLYTHLSATLSGISTIRAFGLQDKVTSDFHECNDHQAESWLMFISSARWFGVRLDLISTVYSMVAIFAPVIALYISGGKLMFNFCNVFLI